MRKDAKRPFCLIVVIFIERCSSHYCEQHHVVTSITNKQGWILFDLCNKEQKGKKKREQYNVVQKSEIALKIWDLNKMVSKLKL